MTACAECGSTEARSMVYCKRYPPEEETGFKGSLICMNHCLKCEFLSDGFRCIYKTEEEKQMAIEYTKCQKCGERFPKGANFCPECGTKQVEECQRCWVMDDKPFSCKQQICPGHKLPILIANDASLKGETANV
jgi:ribosomal protein L40E